MAPCPASSTRLCVYVFSYVFVCVSWAVGTLSLWVEKEREVCLDSLCVRQASICFLFKSYIIVSFLKKGVCVHGSGLRNVWLAVVCRVAVCGSKRRGNCGWRPECGAATAATAPAKSHLSTSSFLSVVLSCVSVNKKKSGNEKKRRKGEAHDNRSGSG